MSWTNCEESLPKEGDYLCIVRYWKTTGHEHGGIGASITSRLHHVIQCHFSPKKGWSCSLMNNIHFETCYWMPLQPLPEDLERL